MIVVLASQINDTLNKLKQNTYNEMVFECLSSFAYRWNCNARKLQ